ncbi:MAG: hypothetical protein DSY33_00420 [Archaeoglobus sp.]|nr:MAG: hypothetical protein DSY33_00420 [Archaeoglobus sp.]
MVDVDLLERFYSKIFTIPRKRISVTLGLITIIFASILNGMVSKSFFAKRYLFIGLSIIVILLAFSRFIGLAFNSRRTFFLALLILIFIEIFDFATIHLGFFELIVLSPAALSTLLTIILYFTSEANEKKVGLTVLASLLILYPVDYHYSFSAPHRMLGYAVSSIFGIVLAMLYINFINKNYNGVNIKEMLKSFILFWLTTDPEKFEAKLREIGDVRKGFVKCLKFSADSCSVKLINTSFHPGPMRNVGGAKLVKKVLEIEDTLYLHSATKHELNPVGTEEVEKIVESITCCEQICKPREPFKLEGKMYTLYAFPFDKVDLLILSGNTVTDDLPPELNEFAEKTFGNEVLLCEGHNAHRSKYEVSKLEIEEIKELIRRASKLRNTKNFVKLSCYFCKKKVETNNICNYIAALVLDYGESVYCILMIDGNNMLLGFRKELEKIAKENGVELVVVTTDNHSKTGISPKVGYKPVGSDYEDVAVTKDFLYQILKDFKERKNCEVKVSYGRKDVSITVIGRKFFEGVEAGFRALGVKALYLFWLCIALQMIVTSLLGIFLIEPLKF